MRQKFHYETSIDTLIGTLKAISSGIKIDSA